jgi:hypothetical protein
MASANLASGVSEDPGSETRFYRFALAPSRERETMIVETPLLSLRLADPARPQMDMHLGQSFFERPHSFGRDLRSR